jgi:N-acetylglutamate synthase-like GNAT family acetyltransferase
MNKMYIIKDFKLQDINLIIERHVVIYNSEYGFDESFRDYVADAIMDFKQNFIKSKENIWVVEEENKFIGSIAIVKVDNETAQLRWFLIEPAARGKGIGNKLMKTAINFCKNKGYKYIFLWTINLLDVARHLYQKYDFTLTEKKEHKIWGKYLVEERWDYKIK